jgi:hypothetical protein
MEELLRLLRSAADTLEPFSRQIRSNTRVWDGMNYAPPTRLQEPDPYALMWFGTLRTMADLLERQRDITDSQLAYLKDIFRGGMGTFNDFSLDTRQWGKDAEEANYKLRFIGDELFEYLNSLAAGRGKSASVS